MLQSLIFCQNPLDRKTVDDDYLGEYETAAQLGVDVSLLNFEALTHDKYVEKALRKIAPRDRPTDAVYRGWMLKPADYAALYEGLLAKNLRLVNSPEQYRHCHYLPDSLRFIAECTPQTVWLKVDGEPDFDAIFRQLRVFDDSPVVLKDYVKSQKHNWDTACFIPDASDAEKVRAVVKTFLDWQRDDLNEGLVFRRFVPLADLTTHSKSGMPLKQEYRLFFLDGRLIGCYHYWEEGDYAAVEPPPVACFVEIAANVESRFFTMDVAKTATGDWLVIELGDAQVSGLPDAADCREFYTALSHGR